MQSVQRLGELAPHTAFRVAIDALEGRLDGWRRGQKDKLWGISATRRVDWGQDSTSHPRLATMGAATQPVGETMEIDEPEGYARAALTIAIGTLQTLHTGGVIDTSERDRIMAAAYEGVAASQFLAARRALVLQMEK